MHYTCTCVGRHDFGSVNPEIRIIEGRIIEVLLYLYEAIFGVFRDIFTLNEKNIIATLLKFKGYIHDHKILPGNIFGLILKNKMAATGIFSTFSKDFCWPSRAKGIIGRDLKFVGYVYKILTGNIFGLILKNKMAATGVSLSVMKSASISLSIGPRGMVCQANL